MTLWQKVYSQLYVIAATISIVLDFNLRFYKDSLHTRWVMFPCILLQPEAFWKCNFASSTYRIAGRQLCKSRLWFQIKGGEIYMSVTFWRFWGYPTRNFEFWTPIYICVTSCVHNAMWDRHSTSRSGLESSYFYIIVNTPCMSLMIIINDRALINFDSLISTTDRHWTT